MPHNIPRTTCKINTTIAEEQHSLLQKGKRSCSAADGKSAWQNLHEAQAHAEALEQSFPRTAPGAPAAVEISKDKMPSGQCERSVMSLGSDTRALLGIVVCICVIL